MKLKVFIHSILILVFIVSNSLILSAQENTVEMADTMHANGKIYVVVSVLSVILCGLLIYLMSIDRRLRNLEKSKRK